jgi:hypothetical protein
MLQPSHQNNPDKDVSYDPAGQVVAVHGDSTVPEQRRQSPGVGSGNGRQVHESGQAAVAPIGDGLVDEVGDEDDLGPPEIVASPQENPDKEEQIVQDEVGGNVGSSSHDGWVFVEQVPNIAELGEKEKDPGIVSLLVYFR